MIGFGGAATLPNIVQPYIQAVVRAVALAGIADLWTTIGDALLAGPEILKHTTVVAVYRDAANAVQSREVGLHSIPLHPFGYDGFTCVTEGCLRPMGDTLARQRDGKVSLVCDRCKWKSRWIQLVDNKYFHTVRKSAAPMIFWHNFPSSPALTTLFGHIDLAAPAGRSQQSGKRKRGQPGPPSAKMEPSD